MSKIPNEVERRAALCDVLQMSDMTGSCQSIRVLTSGINFEPYNICSFLDFLRHIVFTFLHYTLEVPYNNYNDNVHSFLCTSRSFQRLKQ